MRHAPKNTSKENRQNNVIYVMMPFARNYRKNKKTIYAKQITTNPYIKK